MKTQYIYLDNAATSIPLNISIADGAFFANPSSPHKAGKKAKYEINATRIKLCNELGGKPYNYIFNSGATESANFIIQGICKRLHRNESTRNEIIISEIEHAAIFETAYKMELLGFQIKKIKVDHNGTINIDHALSLLNEHTAIVCVMSVNNETGVIQPFNQLFERVKSFNDKIITVCDAVQGVFKGVPLPNLNITDFFFSSGHKIGASKGIGFLYMNEYIMVDPLLYGGGQEEGLRSGTENINGIMSLQKSIDFLTENRYKNKKHLKNLSFTLYNRLNEYGINYRINGSNSSRSDYIHSISFPGMPSDKLMDFLSLENICISRGSACSSVSVKASRTLTAMNLDLATISSTLRVSFSPLNTISEVTIFCEKVSFFKEKFLSEEVF